jgi:two-component system cell cycle response regulator
MTARVLVVDDVELNVKLLEAKLSSEYYQVIPAYNGPTALELADSQLPDIILLDVMMPRMDGPTTLSHLRKNPQTSAIPVFFMTARAQPRELEQFIALGAQGVISKPFDPMTLAFTVRNHLEALERV